ncbi:MAG: metalloregulator ArsR/SmtB family transcription factor [Gemmatimonadota bacterium]|nr:metalloregulator ArsR/SmtB family transcription factor [Candidatus Palauibacterales bacterium]
MIRGPAASLDRTLVALSDPTRRSILDRLMKGPARVTEIAQPFDMSLNAVSKHVRRLERAGLVRREIRGREHLLSFEGGPLSEADQYLDQLRRFWEERLDVLDELLRERKARRESSQKKRSDPK